METIMNGTNKKTDVYMADEDIVELYWQRDEAAIRETDKKYRRYLYKIAYNIVHSEPDCDECLNDTYLGTWNAIPPARPNVFQAFLSKIMRNIAVDRARELHAAKRVPSELIVSIDEIGEALTYDMSPDEEATIAAVGEVLNAFLHGLSERDQLIFVCRYYYCDKVTDIGEMLNISDRTVFRALSDMRDTLKEKLSKEGIEV
jgi:RNA polymerase sigma-70 factor (ECF subfamily)